MQQLLDQLTQTLAPKLVGPLSQQLGLDASAASEAVPAVARPLLEGLRQKAESPEQNVGTLTSLYQYLTNDERPTSAEAAGTAEPGDPAAKLVDRLVGSNMDGFAAKVASQLGVEQGTARSVIMFVAPKIFAYLRGETQQNGFDGLIRQVLGSAGGPKVEAVLKLVQGAGSLGDVTGKLGGLFGS